LGLEFSLGDLTKRACFWIFDQLYLALGANPMSLFCFKLFLETRRTSASLEPLTDIPASISGTRIMAQRPHFAQKSKNCRKSMSLPLTASSTSDNSPAAYARELFKPLKDSCYGQKSTGHYSGRRGRVTVSKVHLNSFHTGKNTEHINHMQR